VRGKWAPERQETDADSSQRLGPYSAAVEDNYRFYLLSMNRIIAAFRAGNPDVKIAVSTLVGRWPAGTEADYASDQGATWWMKEHRLSPQQAAEALARFNDLIRSFARSHGLVVIDAAHEFVDLDRARIQLDFAHMTPEGYELLAEVMYDALRRAGVVDGKPSPRLAELRSKYRLSPDMHAARSAGERQR
jgi:hypothetical protein